MSVRVKKMNYRILSVITVVMLLLTSVVGIFTLRTKAADGDDIGVQINRFSLQLISGGEETEDGYIWTSYDSSAGHRFLFRVVYSFSGTGSLKAGSVQITLPRRILRDRSGRFADQVELSLPHVNEASSRNEFGYRYSNDKIIVTNTRQISAAENGYFELSYATTKTTFDYNDMEMSDICQAQISISRDNGSVSAESSALSVGINTTAFVSFCHNVSPDRFYQRWNNDWGDKPEDADDYYYLEWTVSSYINATQPYNFTLDGSIADPTFVPTQLEPVDPSVSVVGYQLEGTTGYSNVRSVTNLRKTGYRFDKILTRHLKMTYEPQEQYTLYGNAAATVIPRDGRDAANSEKSKAEYIYDTPVFVYPFGNWNSWEYGTTSWQEHFHYEWNIADYRLPEFRSGDIQYIDGDLKYCIYTIGMPYPRTLEENADMDDWHNYGKKSLNYTITDDEFYFMDDITTKLEEITIPEDTDPVGPDEYEIEYLRFSVRINDAEFNERTQRFIMTAGSYLPEDILHFDAKFNGSDDWIEDVATWNLYSNSGTMQQDYVQSIVKGRVTFRPNCTGYRVRTSNPHYRTQMEIYPYCMLKRSPLVVERMGDREKIWLTNKADYLVTDAYGRECYAKDIIARDYIAGFQKMSRMNKTVTGIQNSTAMQSATINWKTSIEEEFITSEGLDYVQQDSGAFYDLLPLGCEAVKDSISVMCDEKYLDDSEIEISLTPNYHQTGRTLMAVFIKERFNKAILTYSTAYTWENIIDYGMLLLNSIAYETGNEFMTGGFPDDGGKLVEADLMKELDSSSEGNRFQYAEHQAVVDVARSANFGLTKRVKATEDQYYNTEATVSQNGSYSYRLRYATDLEKNAKNIILYDSLENYTGSGLSSDFHGTLQSVDVQQMLQHGAAPVVYYCAEAPDLTTQPDLDEVKNGERLWKTEAEFGDLSKARAIAIDVTKNESGDDFVLGSTKSVVAIINMKAPPEDLTGKAEPMAYNEVYLSDTIVEEGEDIEDFYLNHNYTAVNYRVRSDVRILKADALQEDTYIKGVQFTLEGESDYGTVVRQSLLTDRYGKAVFSGIEKGSYTLTETQGNDDYQRNIGSLTVVIDGSGKVFIDGQQVEDGVSYVISDNPRVHTDVFFYKRDFTGSGRLINGAVFELTGQSAYGNDVTMYEESSGGKVIFYNVEQGTYRLTETTPAPNYIPNGTVYQVKVDESGTFVIRVDNTQGKKDADTLSMDSRGVYTIFNERLHSFTLVKQGLTFGMPIEGAVFELTGVSDYGTEVSQTGTTSSGGVLTFTSLESGVYTLRETSAPDGYQLDDTPRAVVIDKHGVVTIDGLEQDEQGGFIVTNKEAGTITVIKKWLDSDSSGRYEEEQQQTQRNIAKRSLEMVHHQLFGINTAPKAPLTDTPSSADGKTPKLPGIVVSSEVPTAYAVFDGGNQQSILTKVTALSNIKSFGRYLGSDTEAQELIENGTAVRIDDGTTAYHIYAWLDSSTGALYWWTDARVVYLTDDSRFLWNGLTQCKTIDAGGINTTRVTDMSRMFMGDSALTSLDITEFDTSNVTTMVSMFQQCSMLEQLDLSSFHTAKVKDMSRMFQECSNLSEIDFSRVNFSQVTDLSYMFYTCSKLQSLDFTGKDMSKVKTMYAMCADCSALSSIAFEGADISGVETMDYMFRNCTSLKEIDLSNRNMQSLESVQYMFRGCSVLKTVNLTNIQTPCLVSLRAMFYECAALTSVDLSSLDTSGVTDLRYLFRGCSSLEEVDLSTFDTSNVTTLQSMFYQCASLKKADLSNFDTSNVTNMGWLFFGCNSLEEMDISSFDTSRCTQMKSMFNGCESMTEIDLSHFDTSNVTDMSYMFNNDKKLKKVNVTSFDTSNVENMTTMFQGCNSLQEVDLSSFDTHNVTDMSWMFNTCYALRTLDLSSFDTSNVTDMYCMFQSCTGLEELDVSSFYTPKLTRTRGMFAFCTPLRELDCSGFIMDKVTDAQGMFRFSTSLTTIYVSELWDISHVPAGQCYIMFYNMPSLEGGAGTRYNGGHIDESYAHIDSVDDPGYFTYKAPAYTPYEPKMTNYTSFGAEGELTSVLSRVCDLTEVKAFRHFEGDPDSITTLIDSGEAVRVDDYTDYHYPIYAWVDDDGTMYWWSQAKNVYLTDQAHCLWKGLSECESISLDGIDSSSLTNASHLFEDCSSLTELSINQISSLSLIDTSYMFKGCSSLKSLDMTLFKATTVEKMAYMFADCSSLTELDYNMLTDKVTDMRGLYSGCTNLESITNSMFRTKSAEDLSDMFSGCKNLKSVDTGKFNTAKAVSMRNMFAGCESMTSLNLGSFNTESVTDMSGMFRDCKSMTTLSVSGFNVTAVQDMSGMFSGCDELKVLDLSKFDTSSAENMSRMFADCPSLTTIYASDLWSTVSLTESEDMFAGDTVLKGGNGTAFDETVADGARALIDKEGQIGYLTDKSIRKDKVTYTTDSDNCEVEIRDDDTWVFTFTGLDPNIPYYVWEEEYEGYVTTNPKDNYAVTLDGIITITNRSEDNPPPDPTFGSLSISKRISGEELTEDDRSRAFLFTVTLTDENDEPLKDTVIFGSTAFRSGVASVRLSDGESLVIPDIPTGYHYAVTEVAADGFEAAVDAPQGIIAADETAQVSFTNTKIYTEEENNSFRLKKVVKGNFELNDTSYEFVLRLSRLRSEQTYYLSDGTSFTADASGNATVGVSLVNGEELTVQNVPIGTKYRISELAGDYLSSFSIKNDAEEGEISQSSGMNTTKNQPLATALETVDSGEDVLVTFTNTVDLRQPLTLQKIVQNADAASNEVFSFTVEITGLAQRELIATDSMGRFRADDAGRLTTELFLHAGESVTFNALPVKAQYRITEQASDYTASYVIRDTQGMDKISRVSNGNAGTNASLSTEWETVNQGEKVQVIYTNTKVQHDVSVTKEIDMTYGNKLPAEYSKEQFVFEASFVGLQPEAVYQVQYQARSATGVLSKESFSANDAGEAVYRFRLQHGQTAVFKNLPVHASYTITEKSAAFYIPAYRITGNDGAVIAKSSESASTTKTALSTELETVDQTDLDVQVLFTNMFAASDYVLPAAGTGDIRLFLLLSFSGLALCAALYWFVNRRKQKNQ